MATPHTVLTHALDQSTSDISRHRPGVRRSGRLRSGLLAGAAAALTVGLLPGTASADPGTDAAQRVADASRQLEVVSEKVNQARVEFEQQTSAAADADRVAADARAALAGLDGQIREVARSAYTAPGLTQFGLLMTSRSAGDYLAQLGTLDAIAGHTNDVVSKVSLVAAKAGSAQAAADAARAKAKKELDDITAQQGTLQSQLAEYQRQYAALNAPQQALVSRAQGTTVAAPSGVIAPSAAAQIAVDTALAQVGDPYVYGANGPNAFDCSGLTQYAYAAAGVVLPHSASSQSVMGAPVAVADLKPGDLLFYGSPAYHVSMYVGNGKMVHASTPGAPVAVVNFNSMTDFTTARRIAG